MMRVFGSHGWSFLVLCLLSLISFAASAAPIVLVPSADAATATNGRVNLYQGVTGRPVSTFIGPLADDVINGLAIGTPV